MDRIFLRDLEIDAVIGIWAWERRIRQKIRISLEMAADVRAAAATDQIEDTLDYKAVAKRVTAFVSESSFQLVETLTERVAEIVIREFDVESVRVVLDKGGAIRGARGVGIEIQRTRDDYLD
jgi:dihydroneopterin aldolase